MLRPTRCREKMNLRRVTGDGEQRGLIWGEETLGRVSRIANTTSEDLTKGPFLASVKTTRHLVHGVGNIRDDGVLH